MDEKKLAQVYAQMIVQSIEIVFHYSARLLDVELSDSPKWLAHIMVGEGGDLIEWKDSKGHTVYARQFSVEFTPVPRPIVAPTREARAIAKEYDRLKFIPPQG